MNEPGGPRRIDHPCPKDVEDRFGPIARVYDVAEVGFLLLGRNPRAAVVELIPREARRILDMGTGTGAVLVRLAAARPDALLTGLDASPRMLAQAERKLKRLRRRGLAPADITLVCASAAETPLEDASFDVLTASLFFHELPLPTRAKAFDEAARVLAPGGTAVICDLDRRPAGWRAPLQWALDLSEEDHAWQLGGDGLTRELVARGLEVQAVDRSIPFLQIVTASKP